MGSKETSSKRQEIYKFFEVIIGTTLTKEQHKQLKAKLKEYSDVENEKTLVQLNLMLEATKNRKLENQHRYKKCDKETCKFCESDRKNKEKV